MVKNRIIIISSSLIAMIAALSFSVASVHGSSVSADTCCHEGHHYSAKNSTSETAGNKEFWACCKCHTQFLEEPAEGEWSAIEELTQTLEETHIAYIAPIARYVSSYDLQTSIEIQGSKITFIGPYDYGYYYERGTFEKATYTTISGTVFEYSGNFTEMSYGEVTEPLDEDIYFNYAANGDLEVLMKEETERDDVVTFVKQ